MHIEKLVKRTDDIKEGPVGGWVHIVFLIVSVDRGHRLSKKSIHAHRSKHIPPSTLEG